MGMQADAYGRSVTVADNGTNVVYTVNNGDIVLTYPSSKRAADVYAIINAMVPAGSQVPDPVVAVQTQANYNQTDSTAVDYIKNKPSTVARVISPLALTLTGAGATGIQVSATKEADVLVWVTTQTTVQIGAVASSNSLVTLKKCATNSAVESDWIACDAGGDLETIGLAIALSEIRTRNDTLTTRLPAGWFIKAVPTGVGTHVENIVYAEKIIYG